MRLGLDGLVAEGPKVRLEPTLARDYQRVLGVAHNAGNNLGTLAQALRYGADVIEIDVISARGRLVAGRTHPLPRLARLGVDGITTANLAILQALG